MSGTKHIFVVILARTAQMGVKRVGQRDARRRPCSVGLQGPRGHILALTARFRNRKMRF